MPVTITIFPITNVLAAIRPGISTLPVFTISTNTFGCAFCSIYCAFYYVNFTFFSIYYAFYYVNFAFISIEFAFYYAYFAIYYINFTFFSVNFASHVFFCFVIHSLRACCFFTYKHIIFPHTSINCAIRIS